MSYFGLKRYVTRSDYDSSIRAAQNYVSNIPDHAKDYLLRKPFLCTPDKSQFYTDMYDALSLIQELNIKSAGKILEVGCGSGWMTEILIGLGYEVDALEPCKDILNIAIKKIDTFSKHLQITPKVNFYCETLEECILQGSIYDGIIFYATLHHMVDEVKCLKKCYSLLCNGGILGIHEGAWLPGNKDVEEKLKNETKKYGTLESPFTTEYITYLLQECGFININRYFQINGLYKNGESQIKEKAQARKDDYNIITATKYNSQTTTKEPMADTKAEMFLLNMNIENNVIRLKVRIKNCGKTIWLKESSGNGYVTISLKSSTIEANWRNNIPMDIMPDEEVTLNLVYQMPDDYTKLEWYFDLINEGYYWFSQKGTEPLRII
jgi:ubiquinone/menaquinone biosynthesis C-methylase UbiE